MTEARIKTLRWRAAVMLEYGFLEGRDWLEMLDEIERLQKRDRILHYPDGSTQEVIGYVYDLAEDGTPMWHQVEDEDIYWAWSPWKTRETK